MSENTLRDNRRKKFFMVDNDTIDAYGALIGVYGFAVYSLLLRYAGSSDTAFPSYQTIGEKFGFSERQAVRTVGALVAAGLIEKTTRFAPNGATTSNLYTLVDIPPVTVSHRGGDSQSYGGVTVSHGEGDPESYYKEPSKKTQLTKTQLTKTTSTRADDSKTNQPPRARAETETAPNNNGLVGLEFQQQSLPQAIAAETELTAITATAVAPPSSERPPDVAEQVRNIALLTDPDVGLSVQKAHFFAQGESFAYLLYQVGAWWDDYQAGSVDGAGALHKRIVENWQPDKLSEAFLRSALYHRHYPLEPPRAEVWREWSSAAALPAHVIGGPERPSWLDELDDDVRLLLEVLPAPIYSYSYDEVDS